MSEHTFLTKPDSWREVEETCAPMTNEGDSDRASEACAEIGHEWTEAGGGLLICAHCEAEKWGYDHEI